eukprot:174824_1
MSLLDRLLGIKRSSEIDVKYQKCKQHIRTLRGKITRKLDEKDDKTLAKFNDMYGSLLQYESSDEHKAKSSANQPGPTPVDIPLKSRPKHHFPIKSPHANQKFKGDANFALQRSLKGHNDKIYAMRWSPDNKNIVSASQDGSLVVWDMQQTFNKKLGIPLRMAWVMSVDYSPNGNLIASAGLDNLCSIFNVQDKIGWASEMIRPHRELQQHEGYIACTRFVDNEHILTASGD